jgi:hypothetical protein
MTDIERLELAHITGGVDWYHAFRQGLSWGDRAANYNPPTGPIPDAITPNPAPYKQPDHPIPSPLPDPIGDAKRAGGFFAGMAKGVYDSWGKK